jgi:hypothetical protein
MKVHEIPVELHGYPIELLKPEIHSNNVYSPVIFQKNVCFHSKDLC